MKIRPGYINLVSNPGGGFTFPTGQILAPDGTAAAPAYSFVSQTGTGWGLQSTNRIFYSGAGTAYAEFAPFRFYLQSTLLFGWSNGAIGGTMDLALARDSAGVLAQRNGTNPQAFRLYRTYTDASNYERLTITNGSAAATNSMNILAENAGTGGQRSLGLGSDGLVRWTVRLGTGHFLPETTVTHDLGSDTLRVRSMYAARYVPILATVTYSASMTPDAQAGDTQSITATNGTAFTINAPTNPATGQRMTVMLRNTSGGALGAATWNAVFKMAAWTNPANGNSRSITFVYDGTNWVEITRTTADVPN